MLLAEYREIARIPNMLKKALYYRKTHFNMEEIPTSYTLGKGHCKFFYDKGMFLAERFELIVVELRHRGYKLQYDDSSIFYVSDLFWNNYTPTKEALELNRERIKDRLTKQKEDRL